VEGGGGGSPSFVTQNELRQKNCSLVRGLHANLIRFITKEGFHRELEDTVEITVTNSPIPLNRFTNKECKLAMLTKFVGDIYVDPYEVSQIGGLRDMIRIQNNWTDLESPAWLAKSNSTVFVQLTVKSTGNLVASDTIRIPIHFRYQKPQSHSRFDGHPDLELLVGNGGMMNPAGYIPVNVPLPRLLLHCEDWDYQQTANEHCHFVKTLCSSKSSVDSMCQWVALPYKSNSKVNTVFIPVGDSDSQLLITVATFLVITGGVIFLSFTLINAKTEMSKRQHRE